MNGKWLAQRSIYRDGTDLVFVHRWGDKMAVAKHVEFTMVEQSSNMLIAEPTLELRGDSGQSLFQALWDAGFRPSDGAGSGAEAQALKAHIVFAEHVARALLPPPQCSSPESVK